MRLFIANIDYGADEADLRGFLESAGHVPDEVTICRNPETGEPKGFGFVGVDEGLRAIAELNGKKFLTRPLVVREAESKPRSPRAWGAGR